MFDRAQPTRHVKVGCGIFVTKVKDISRNIIHKGRRERILVDKAIDSALQVIRAISVWSLLSQMIGQLAYTQ
jgi:hypothetical protein